MTNKRERVTGIGDREVLKQYFEVSDSINTVPIDSVSTVTTNPLNFKYNEDSILKELSYYIQSTYSQHYVGKNNIQTVDVWDSMGSADTSTRDAALKYLMRYGKKSGHNKKDLLKALHFIILLWHFTQNKETEK